MSLNVISRETLHNKYNIKGYSLIVAREDGAIVFSVKENGEILFDAEKLESCKRVLNVMSALKDEINIINNDNDKSIHRKSIHHR